MFFRKCLSITLFLGCVSLFLFPHISYADYTGEMETKKTLFESAAKRMKKAVGHYDNIKGAMEDLLGEWNDNTDEIESGADVTLKVFVGGIIGAAVAASSGGSLAPAAYSIVLSGISGSKTLTDIYDLQEYVLAIITTRSILDTALSNVQAYYSGGNVLVENDSQQDEYQTTAGYTAMYTDYLEECWEHAPWHITEQGVSTKMDYDDVYRRITTNVNGDKDYFHEDGSGSGFNHAWSTPSTYKHWDAPYTSGLYDWNTEALPRDYSCSGGCGDFFDTPSGDPSHQTTCHESHIYSQSGRIVDLGNSYSYWICDTDDHTCPMKKYHRQLCPGTCNKKNGYLAVSAGMSGYVYPHLVGCEKDERRTIGNFFIFNGCDGTYYSCAGVSTCTNVENHVDDDEEANAGGDETDQVAASCGTAGHFISDESDHSAAGCGTTDHFACDSLDHSSSYTCNIPPCSNRVVPSCLALCPETDSHGTTPDPTPTPAPAPTPAPTPESTPTTVACGGNGWTGCTEQVSSENDHYVSSCSNCSNSYWTCRPVHGAVKHEPPRTCARNGCDNTFTLCSRPPCDVNSEWKCQ